MSESPVADEHKCIIKKKIEE